MIQRVMTLITAFLLTALPLTAMAQNSGPGNMGGRQGMMDGMMDCMGGGMGFMMIFPMLIMILVIVLLVMGIIALAKYIRQG